MKKMLLIGMMCASCVTTAIGVEEHRYFEFGQEVKLEGVVIMRTFYGPPGYGENPKEDKLETGFYLLLDRGIDVSGDAEKGEWSSYLGEAEIHLAPEPKMIDALSAVVRKKQRVIVWGKLFEKLTGHHHTDVLLLVSKLEVVNNE